MMSNSSSTPRTATTTPREAHIILLGDSIFDNGVYVRGGGPSVIQQLQAKAKPFGWKASLLARDGDIVKGIPRQLTKLPSDASHLFISVGGNNALGYMGVLTAKASSVGEALFHLNQVRKKFQQDYSSMLSEVLSRRLPTTICTVYNPRYQNVSPQQQEMCEAGICLLNDIILAEAEKHGIPVIDLKAICNEASDYANPIEPDAPGGDKITNNIIAVMREQNFTQRRTVVYADAK